MESSRNGARTARPGLSFLLPVLATLAADILYGIAPVLVRLYSLGNSNPVFFTFLRVTFGIPLLFLASFVSERGRMTKPKHVGEVVRLAVVGSFLVCAQVTVAIASYYVQATIVSIFQMVQPVLAVLISVVTRTETAPNLRTLHGWGKVIAIAVTVTGSVLIVTEAPSHGQSVTNSSSQACTSHGIVTNSPTERITGYILLVINITFFCSYVVLQKRLLYQKREYQRWKLHPVTMTAWATLLGYPFQLAILPAGRLMMSNRCGRDIGMWTMRGRSIWAVEYQVFFNSSLCVLLIAWSVSHLPPSLVTVWVPSQLMSTMLLAFFVLNEKLNAVQYGCMVVILVGFFLVVWSRRREERLQEADRDSDGHLLDNTDSHLVNDFVLGAVDSADGKLVFSSDLSETLSDSRYGGDEHRTLSLGDDGGEDVEEALL